MRDMAGMADMAAARQDAGQQREMTPVHISPGRVAVCRGHYIAPAGLL